MRFFANSSTTYKDRISAAHLYSGTCSALVPEYIRHGLYGDSILNIETDFLVPGNTYYLKLSRTVSSCSSCIQDGKAHFDLVNLFTPHNPYTGPGCFPNNLNCEEILNGSFENYNQLPSGVSGMVLNSGVSNCCFWYAPTGGTSDYFNVNATSGRVGIPHNENSCLADHNGGTAYAGLGAWESNGGYNTEYIQEKLQNPMLAGETYSLSFWVALAEESKYGISDISACFTNSGFSTGYPYYVVPPTGSTVITNTTGVITFTGWTLITGTLTVPRGQCYNYITIGNFNPSTTFSATVISGCSQIATYSVTSDSYYFVDDVSLQKTGFATITLVDNVFGCSPTSYTITAAGPTDCNTGLGAYSYSWSTGAITSVITGTLNTPTLFTVTASSPGCFIPNSYSTLISIPPGLGPFNVNGNLCAGQVSTLSVSPVFSNSNYSWNPNSNVSCNFPCSSATISNPLAGSVYTVTATDISTNCSSTQTITVVSPPVVTASVVSGNNKCAGSGPIVLSASGVGNSGTYVWSNGQSGQTITLSPTPTISTIYTVTGTPGTGGCPGIGTVTVSVYPTPTVSINPFPNPTDICLSSQSTVTLSASSSTGSYTWSANAGSVINNSVVVSPSVTTTYSVSTYLSSDGCSANAAITVTVQCLCNQGTVYGNSILYNLGGSAVHSFTNNVSVTAGTSLTLNNKVMYFSPNISLTVPATATLTLNHCHLLSCTDMWNGILVQPGATLIVQGNSFGSSMIEDAYTAIDCPSWNSTGNSLSVNNAIFNRNETGIQITNFNFAGVAFPASIINSVFTCRILPYSASTFNWNGPLVSALKTVVTPPNTLPAPYALANTPSYSMTITKPGFSHSSRFGIYLDNVGVSNFNGIVLSSFPSITYNGILIGDPVTLSNRNLFDGLNYGIYALGSNFTCVNNSFELMQLSGQKLFQNSGTAIYANNIYLLSNLQYTRADITYPGYAGIAPTVAQEQFNNQFYDNHYGSLLLNYTETNISGTLVQSTQIYNPVCISAGTHPGSYGHFIESPIFTDNFTRHNNLINIETSIAFYAGVYTSGSNLVQKNGTTHIDYNNISANYGAPPTTQYVSNAIVQEDVINCNSNSNCHFLTSLYEISASQNVISYAFRGINQTNWSNDHSFFCDSNNITLALEANDPCAGNPTDQYGVGLFTNEGSYCADNFVTGPGISKLKLRGYYRNDDQDYLMLCNTAKNTGIGFEFEGGNFFSSGNGVQWQNNTMTNNQRGMAVTNAVLGNQGNSFTPNDNFWDPSTNWQLGVQDQTYNTFSTTNLNFSTLFVRNVNGYNPSVNNSNLGGNWAYTNSTSLSFHYPQSIMILNSPPPLQSCPCFTCQSNGSTNKAMLSSIAADSILYPVIQIQNTYNNQKKLYRIMQKDSTWKDSSASLLSFYNASMAGNFSKLSSVESSLNEGNASGAQSVLSSISSSGNIETNFINFYQAYIDYLNGNYTSADSLAVITLAQACPATDGAVVFQARSFYNSLYAIHKHFDNGCNYATMPPSARLATHLIESNRIEKEFYLYPNPTSDFLILENKNIKDFNTQVVFLDLTGRVLVEEVVSFLSGNARLSVNLPDGIYLLRLKSSFGNFLYYKIIISK